MRKAKTYSSCHSLPLAWYFFPNSICLGFMGLILSSYNVNAMVWASLAIASLTGTVPVFNDWTVFFTWSMSREGSVPKAASIISWWPGNVGLLRTYSIFGMFLLADTRMNISYSLKVLGNLKDFLPKSFALLSVSSFAVSTAFEAGAMGLRTKGSERAPVVIQFTILTLRTNNGRCHAPWPTQSAIRIVLKSLICECIVVSMMRVENFSGLGSRATIKNLRVLSGWRSGWPAPSRLSSNRTANLRM